MNQPATGARRALSTLLLLAASFAAVSGQTPEQRRRLANPPPVAPRWEKVYSEPGAGPASPAATFRAVYSAPLGARDATRATGLRWLWVGDDRGFLRLAVLDPNSQATLGPTPNALAQYVGFSRVEVDNVGATDPQSRRVNAIYFDEHGTGYLLRGGGLYMSVNAGFSWQLLSDAPTPDTSDKGAATLYSLAVTSKRACLVGVYGQGAVVKDSLILCANRDSRRGLEGAEWKRVMAPVQTQLLHVVLRENGHGYIVGALGTILKTTDGGKEWKPLVNESEALFQSYFTDDKTGWAVGQFGTFLNTVDGETWTPVRHNFAAQLASTTLRGVKFAEDKRHGWVVGEQGIILHTADGGATWQLQPTPSKEAMHALYVDDTFCWAVGGNGTIWRYRLGGEPPRPASARRTHAGRSAG